jgi:hypothetical protein
MFDGIFGIFEALLIANTVPELVIIEELFCVYVSAVMLSAPE